MPHGLGMRLDKSCDKVRILMACGRMFEGKPGPAHRLVDAHRKFCETCSGDVQKVNAGAEHVSIKPVSIRADMRAELFVKKTLLYSHVGITRDESKVAGTVA